MKNSIRSLVALVAFGACALGAQAQAVKIAIVDIAKLYDNHYSTIEQNAKLQADDQKAQEEVGRLRKELDALVEEYKGLNEQSNNAALSNDAKAKAQAEAQKKLEAIQGKQNEGNKFIQDTRNILGQRLQNFRNLMLEEITKIAVDVAKRKGTTILLEKSGQSSIGVSTIVYSDPGFEITDEVMAEINKKRPAGAPTAAPTPSAPAAPMAPMSAPTNTAAPAITVPGVTPKK